MIGRFERFSFAICAISHYWHKIVSEEMKKYGLKGPYAIYLVALYACPDGITAAKLSKLCSKDKADTSRIVAVMEKKGLVYKEGDNHYRALIKLTSEGKTAAEHIKKRAEIAVDIAGGEISEENREIFYKSLETICLNIQSMSSEGIPQHEKGEH